MLLPGTQMHIVTFGFVCIEIVIFFYLLIYRLARPDDKTAFLNIILISLLITYNVTGGLLPDPKLPGSEFIQLVIAYFTGFITPCFFPYYVYKAFGLEKMKFHAYKGVYLFLILPYFIFIIVYAITNNINTAKNLLVLPVLYALWVIYSLIKAIKFKYQQDFYSNESKEEVAVLFLSITPWVGLPIIDYFNLGQAAEASITNTGFLLLLGLHLKRHIQELRKEHEKVVDSEQRLYDWNTKLQEEVNKRTKELEKINEQRTNTFVNLAHETKTPLTLINNYLEEYINSKGSSEELNVVKKNIEKLSTDIVNFFDLERFNKGVAVYDHDQVSNFSEILKENLVLFKEYSKKRAIELNDTIEDDVFIKADPVAINRIVNNLVENAIKYSNDSCVIEISLLSKDGKLTFSVKDCGVGIPPELHKKVFEPYYQIANEKRSVQGMGLGLPIVKKVVQDLNGDIQIDSDPKKEAGTKITIVLNRYVKREGEAIAPNTVNNKISSAPIDEISLDNVFHQPTKPTIFIVEDNISMINYLSKKLREKYNVYTAINGNEALRKIKTLPAIPDLIISDVMMDKLDGFTFAKILSQDAAYNHIPFIFLSAKSTRQDKLQGLKLGAIDFIQKPFSIHELTQKVESILETVNRQKRAILNSAITALGNNESSASKNGVDKFEQNCQIYNLTSREKDIAKLVCEGQKYKAIGDALYISERTVTKHVQNIFEKVGVSNKVELINKLEG
jgi:signal transduction histidine kinase/DNA-binding NarL/FixJ family response regulator